MLCRKPWRCSVLQASLPSIDVFLSSCRISFRPPSSVGVVVIPGMRNAVCDPTFDTETAAAFDIAADHIISKSFFFTSAVANEAPNGFPVFTECHPLDCGQTSKAFPRQVQGYCLDPQFALLGAIGLAFEKEAASYDNRVSTVANAIPLRVAMLVALDTFKSNQATKSLSSEIVLSSAQLVTLPAGRSWMGYCLLWLTTYALDVRPTL